MRRVAFAAMAVGCGLATASVAETAQHSQNKAQLSKRLEAAAFAPATQSDPIAGLLARETYQAGQGPVRWSTNQFQLAGSGDSGAVDSVRITTGDVLRGPGGLPLNLDRADFDTRAYEVAFIRDWPSAVRFAAGDLDLDISPHAGVGVSRGGGSAEAGATLRLGQNLDDSLERRLKGLGVRDGASFGDQGRWYLFAAASGRAVGMNMLRGDGGWDRAGWSTDPSSALIGDAQAGIGWRRGDTQASIGYIHREVKGAHMLWGQEAKDDSLVAVSLTIKPRR